MQNSLKMKTNIQNFKNIRKELISESVLIPEIKFLSFSAKQIYRYKNVKEFVILRDQIQSADINLGDYIKPEWGVIYQVTDIQIINDITQYKEYGYLDPELLAEYLGDTSHIFKIIKLNKLIKKNIRRFFYDCEFDETPFGIKFISIGIVNEKGQELYLIDKDYDWTRTSTWLYNNVYPYIKVAPDYYKLSKDLIKQKVLNFIQPTPIDDIKLYGYYSAYDHVVLSQLFGRMIDLPEGMPMYTNDLKQIIDYYGINVNKLLPDPQLNQHDALSDAKWNFKLYNRIKQTLNVQI